MATYYVRSSGGNDTNDGLSFANGWATVQKAADTAVAGDLVLICADGTHSPSSQVDFDTNSGSAANNRIVFRGAASDGTDNGTVATISGSGLSAGHDLFEFATATNARWLRFQNLRLTAGKTHNVNTVGSHYGIEFINCRIDTAATDGVRFDTSGTILTFYNCEIDSNGAEGLGQSTSARGTARCYGCAIHDNGGSGIDLGGTPSSVIVATAIYDNGSHGVVVYGSSHRIDVISCTIDGNTSNGIEVTDAGELTVVNSLITNNGGYGIDYNGTRRIGLRANNLYYTNTSGDVDLAGGLSDTDYGSTTGSDPLYTSRTDGSENYALQSTSPAKAAGFPGALKAGGTGYLDIGALQRQEPTGGSSPRFGDRTGGLR